MRVIKLIFLLLLLHNPSFGQVYKFINGKWFNGHSFKQEIWFSENGILTQKEPGKIISIVDLNGGFVVPPFGEAHNHNVRYFSEFKELSNQYLRDGIFYVKNPNSLVESKTDLISKNMINNKNFIDATFANGGLTVLGGHPTRFFANTPEGEGNFYHYINTPEDLENKWPAILAAKPDFIKTYLLFSEEYEKRKDDPRYEGFKGLDPKVLSLIVMKAHEAGLRVSTHIETSRDFHTAIACGVDEVNHMPGFRGDPMIGISMPDDFENKFTIKEEDAILAAKNGTVVVTTIGDFSEIPFIFELRRAGDKVHTQNLSTLKKANAKIALGSDAYEKNSLIEITYLKNTKVFSNLELLKMLCEVTPLTIFPKRKISVFKEGFEASFLVLRADPLINIENVMKIKHWVKQGTILDSVLKK